MVKAQEVKALGTSGEVHGKHGLLGMQTHPECRHGRRRQLAGRVGLLAGGAQDDEVVGVSDRRFPAAARRWPTPHRGR